MGKNVNVYKYMSLKLLSLIYLQLTDLLVRAKTRKGRGKSER